LIQILGYVSQMQHPDAVKQANLILTKIYSYMGDEFVNFGNKLLNENQPIQSGAGQQAVQGQQTSNQNGIPQSQMEQVTRELANGPQ
jgi:hypothetical protein